MTVPFLLGLTGSIGMGKTTTAGFFADAGVSVWSADSAVHRLYAQSKSVIDAVCAKFPNALKNGQINRDALMVYLRDNPKDFALLESIIYPFIAQDRLDFIAKNLDSSLIVFDIPLLFENNLQTEFNAVLVVSTDAENQRKRVWARPKMTIKKLDIILGKQMPDEEKRARADYVIETLTLDQTRAQVHDLIEKLTG